MSTDLLEGLDPITYEVLSHRLTAIHTELAATIKAMSGSPIATEAGDFNTSVMDADGEALAVGVLVTAHAVTQTHVVRHILGEYGRGFVRPGDMFLANDPYLGALHQNDVICVAPVFLESGDLIAWVGSAVHQVDIGGPVAGGFSVGARSVFEEPMPFPPLRIVEGGVVRPDIEGQYLRRSRHPELLRLDFRAQVGANRVAHDRLLDTVAEFGIDAVRATFAGMRRIVAHQFRARIAELAHGEWRQTLLIDGDGIGDDVYAVNLLLRNDGERLTFDFRGSSPQAPALINCTRPALEGSVIAGILPLLCPDIAWCPTGIDECVEILSTEGTVCHARWPGGVSAGSVSASRVVIIAVAAAIGDLLASGAVLTERAAGSWAGSAQSLNLFGKRADGSSFGTMILDSVGGGGGATSTSDGLDSGGSITSMSTSIANVETNEYLFPMLYLHRRHREGSAGVGTFNGGRGIEIAFALHGAGDEAADAVVISHGVAVDPSPGVAGGQPGGRCSSEIVHDADVLASLGTGEITGSSVEALTSKAKFHLRDRDVYIARAPGGAGYGPPQDRAGDGAAALQATGTVEVERWTLVDGSTAARVRDVDASGRIVADGVRIIAGPTGSSDNSAHVGA